VAYEFLLGEWEDEVRVLAGDASEADASDDKLALDSFAPSTEDRIKELVSDWAAKKITHAADFNRAAIRHLAAKACDLMLVKAKQRERIGGEYEYDLAKIDWPLRKQELMNEFYEYLGLTGTVLATMPYIDKIERDPAMFAEIEVEE